MALTDQFTESRAALAQGLKNAQERLESAMGRFQQGLRCVKSWPRWLQAELDDYESSGQRQHLQFFIHGAQSAWETLTYAQREAVRRARELDEVQRNVARDTMLMRSMQTSLAFMIHLETRGEDELAEKIVRQEADKHRKRELLDAYLQYLIDPGFEDQLIEQLSPEPESEEGIVLRPDFSFLPERTREVIDMLEAGHSLGEIADQLGIRKGTVYEYVRRFRVRRERVTGVQLRFEVGEEGPPVEPILGRGAERLSCFHPDEHSESN